jgi:exportin-1
MKELLINLAEFNWPTTKTFILTKIEKQNQEEFSFDILNSLSWAVGSMSGFIPEHEEKPFLIAVIRVFYSINTDFAASLRG